MFTLLIENATQGEGKQRAGLTGFLEHYSKSRPPLPVLFHHLPETSEISFISALLGLYFFSSNLKLFSFPSESILASIFSVYVCIYEYASPQVLPTFFFT